MGEAKVEGGARAWPLARWIGLGLLLLALILIPFLAFGDALGAWSAALLAALADRPLLGGGFIVALLAGDVVLPVPSSLVSAMAGAAYGLILGATLIWIGMTLGCVLGYVLGAGAGGVLVARWVGRDQVAKAQRLFDGWGPIAVVLTRAVPVLAEGAVLAAGAARAPFWPFLAAAALANTGVALAYAGIGATAAASQSFLIVFLGLTAIPAIGWAIWRSIARRRAVAA